VFSTGVPLNIGVPPIALKGAAESNQEMGAK